MDKRHIKHLVKLRAIVAIAVTLSSCSFNIKDSKPMESNCQAVDNKQSSEQMQAKTPINIPNTKEIMNSLCSDKF